MRTVIALGAACLAITGCATSELGGSRSRLFTTQGGFEFHTVANASVPEDSAGAESFRLAYLKKNLEANDICKGGYVIENRDYIKSPKLLEIESGNLIYKGRCL